MTRDNVVFALCGLLLGLIVGSLVIGPRVAQSKLAGATSAQVAETEAVPAAQPGVPAAGAQGSPMGMVMQQLATLKQTVEREPNNVTALVQLGNMYMDAAKFPQAIDYFQRALAIRDDAAVRTDLGICLKQTGQLDKALEAFRAAEASSPAQWQAAYNEAIVLYQMKRIDDARAVAARLAQSRPSDPDVQRLVQELAK